MNNRFYTSILLFTVLQAIASAQSGAQLISTAYDTPRVVAPGQIIRLQVTGLQLVLPDNARVLKAATAPLPNTLGGISVTVTQSSRVGTGDPVTEGPYGPYNAPMVSIDQTALPVTAITVQMPYVLQVSFTGIDVSTQIVIWENGIQSQAFLVLAAYDSVRLVTSCDNQTLASSCQSIVTHADGTVISWQSPAKPNEVIVIYGWGFGAALGVPVAGSVTPAPAPKIAVRGVSFAFMQNAGAIAVPGPILWDGSFTSQTTGDVFLTPGQIGLYQMNVRLPATFPSVPPCASPYESNLLISVRGAESVGSAAICVGSL